VSPSETKVRVSPPGSVTGRLSAPGQFEQTSVRVRGGTADGARRQQVSGIQVAAADGVVGELLTHVPVQVLEVGAGDAVGRTHPFGLKQHLKIDVIGPISGRRR
jgi:hypothetical protein